MVLNQDENLETHEIQTGFLHSTSALTTGILYSIVEYKTVTECGMNVVQE